MGGDFSFVCEYKAGRERDLIITFSNKNKNTGEKHLLDPKVNEMAHVVIPYVFMLSLCVTWRGTQFPSPRSFLVST